MDYQDYRNNKMHNDSSVREQKKEKNWSSTVRQSRAREGAELSANVSVDDLSQIRDQRTSMTNIEENDDNSNALDRSRKSRSSSQLGSLPSSVQMDSNPIGQQMALSGV